MRVDPNINQILAIMLMRIFLLYIIECKTNKIITAQKFECSHKYRHGI